jgi:acetyl-CoA decarbonylase/synthase complex subunit gamma
MKNLTIINYLETPAGQVPKVGTSLHFQDHLGTLKARLNINRNNYIIKPGLYATGEPDSNSPVFVTANYKMSFDYLRKELIKIDAWILVLDTRGINVWCAAGKGTFGTDEIIKKLHDTKLANIVSHHQLILPQLGAPGVSAHKIKEKTGFKVIYGPIKAADIPVFLNNKKKATTKMRKVTFKILDRFILTGVEIVNSLKYFSLLIIIFIFLSGISRTGFSISKALSGSLVSLLFLSCAFFSGAFITPVLLPYIPGRAFAFKGFVVSSTLYLLIISLNTVLSDLIFIELTAWFLIISAISSFLAMNFTGASTFTSLSGVKKEMKIALPIQISAISVGLVLWIINKLI